MLTLADKGGEEVWQILTLADKGGRGFGKYWLRLTKGGGVWQMLTLTDNGGRGSGKCWHWLTKGGGKTIPSNFWLTWFVNSLNCVGCAMQYWLRPIEAMCHRWLLCSRKKKHFLPSYVTPKTWLFADWKRFKAPFLKKSVQIYIFPKKGSFGHQKFITI